MRRENGDGRRGRFAVERIDSVNPLSGEVTLLGLGTAGAGRLGPHRPPQVLAASAEALLAEEENRLALYFYTPAR